MRAAVFEGNHKFNIVERPVPDIGSNEVLFRVNSCGVCGTDVHIVNGEKGSADVTLPIVLGHEFYD